MYENPFRDDEIVQAELVENPYQPPRYYAQRPKPSEPKEMPVITIAACLVALFLATGLCNAAGATLLGVFCGLAFLLLCLGAIAYPLVRDIVWFIRR